MEDDIYTLKQRVKYLEQANDELKRHVEKIALDHSDAMVHNKKHKKQISEESKLKWAFYHQHKDAIKKDLQMQGHVVVYWQAVKKTTDDMYDRAKVQDNV